MIFNDLVLGRMHRLDTCMINIYFSVHIQPTYTFLKFFFFKLFNSQKKRKNIVNGLDTEKIVVKQITRGGVFR